MAAVHDRCATGRCLQHDYQQVSALHLLHERQSGVDRDKAMSLPSCCGSYKVVMQVHRTLQTAASVLAWFQYGLAQLHAKLTTLAPHDTAE